MSGVIGVSPNMKSGVIGLPPKGTWVLLQEKDADGETTDLGNGTTGGFVYSTTPFCSTFRDYKIVGSEVNVTSGTDSNIQFRWSIGGLITSNYKFISEGRDSNNTHRHAKGNSDAGSSYITGDGNLQQGTGYGGINFEMFIMNARSSQRHVITGIAGWRCGNNSGHLQHTQFTANREGTTGAIDYFVFMAPSSDFDGGKLSLYGRVA